MIYRLLPEFPELEAASLISVNFNAGGEDAPLMEGFGLSYKLQEPLSFVSCCSRAPSRFPSSLL